MGISRREAEPLTVELAPGETPAQALWMKSSYTHSGVVPRTASVGMNVSRRRIKSSRCRTRQEQVRLDFVSSVRHAPNWDASQQRARTGSFG
jgi:hypothetical protein